MKGKRYSTEEKVRILREADAGKSIVDICREKNISDVTYHRWKRQFDANRHEHGLGRYFPDRHRGNLCRRVFLGYLRNG